MLYGGANAGEVILEPDGSYKKNRYSTYVQASYPVISGQKVNLDAFVGAGFSLNGNTFLYGNGKNNFDIVNVGVKAGKVIKITDHYSLPVSMMAMWNPSNKYARIQLAATVDLNLIFTHDIAATQKFFEWCSFCRSLLARKFESLGFAIDHKSPGFYGLTDIFTFE
jgi:hypothetical protein